MVEASLDYATAGLRAKASAPCPPGAMASIGVMPAASWVLAALVVAAVLGLLATVVALSVFRRRRKDQRNTREKETQAEDSRIMTEEQKRQALITKRRQEKEDKKTSKNSRVENMMDRYLEMRTKQHEEEAVAREKEFSQAADYSVKKCVSMLSSMDVTKQREGKGFCA
uniref:Uncharacterized protein n=1 Tax=Oryza brachyantha TaxID=4533 RepID=J3M258_ORYBR